MVGQLLDPNKIDQQVRTLLDSGQVSEEEIYNATRQGNAAFRAQVDESIRIHRTARLVTDQEAVDIADLTAVANNRPALVADAQEAKKGKAPAELRILGDSFQQYLGNQSLTDVAATSDNPAALAETISTILQNKNAAVISGVREAIRNDPSTDYSINALEQRQMAQRTLGQQYQNEAADLRAALDEARLKAIDLEAGRINPDDNAFVELYKRSFNGDTFPLAAVALEATPRNIYDQWRRLTALQEADLADTGWFNRMINVAFPYMSIVEARERMLQMSPEEAREAVIKMTDHLKSSNNVMGNNFSNFLLTEEVLSDEFINELNPTADKGLLLFSSFLSNLASAAELAVFLKGASRVGIRATAFVASNSGVTRRLLLQQNPERFLAGLRAEFNGTTTGEMATAGKINIAQTQLPAPGARATDDPLVNFPDGVASDEAVARLEDLTTSAIQMSQRTGAGMFDIPQQARIIDEVVAEAEAANVGRVRPALSELDVLDDMSGVELRMMVGANDTGGFKSLDEAVAYAKNEAGVPMSDLRYFRVKSDGTLEQFRPAFDGKGELKGSPPGEYYLQVGYKHTFSPDDVRYFDETPVVTGNWFGTTFGVPSSFLDTATVGKYVRSYLREQELTNLLDAMVAPLFRNLNRAQRRTVNGMMAWAEEVGTTTGKMPTLDELKAKFPGASSQELEGFYTARHFQDTLYEINNHRIRNNWQARGYKTLGKGSSRTKYHGRPLTRSDVGTGSRSAYDPETGKTRDFTEEDLDAWFESGNSFIELDTPIAGSRGNRHRYVLVDKTQGYGLRSLDRHVLEYRPGYNTRIYEDAHFVQRIDDKANIDGKTETHTSTVRVASTAREAQQFSERVMDAIGRRKMKGAWNKSWPMARKAQILKDKYDIRVEVSRDSRLSDRDRVQIDLEKFRTEGRLFFDEKQPRPLKNTENKNADLVDPINVIQRTSRMVARQVATEDLVNAQKIQFKQKYGDVINIARTDTSAEIDAELSRIIRAGSDEERAKAIRARAWWRYIRFMEGTMNADPGIFKRTAIRLGEWVDYNVGAKIGGRAYTKEFARGMGKADLIQTSKSLAFLHFLTARPIRQLVLQGMQHINLQILDPTYIGKWQTDTFSLLSSMKRLSRSQQDEAVMGLKRKQAARMMGLDDEEMDIVTTEFATSGLIPGVNVHSYAGGQPKGVNNLPRTALGGAVQSVTNVARRPIDIARSLGFDMGEQFNVTASWLMALRRTMKENKFKSVKELNAKHWDDIANRGSQYALAMHKANAAPWQYGVVSLPLQFLQFTHKWLLTMLGASKTMRKIGLANQQFTREESIKLIVGQSLMWGGAGFAMKDPIMAGFTQAEVWARETGNQAVLTVLDMLGEDGKDFIASGLVDWGADELIRRLAEDEDLDFAFEDSFSPGMGLKSVVEKVLEWTGEPVMLGEIALGPSGQVYGNIARAFNYGQYIHGKAAEYLTPGERAQMTIEAAAEGLLAGFSDMYKIEMARKMGQWTNTQGAPTGLEAKWEELVMKGTLGVNPQRLLDYWRVTRNVGDMRRTLRDDARNNASVVRELFLKFRDGKITEERFLHFALAVATGIEAYADHGLEAEFRQEFVQAINQIQTDDGTGLQMAIAELIMKGYTGDVVQDAINAGLIDPKYEQITRDFLDKQRQEKPEMAEDYAEDAEETILNFGRKTNGNR